MGHQSNVAEPVTIRLAPAMQAVLLMWFGATSVFAAIFVAVAIARGALVGALVAAVFVVVPAVAGWRWSTLAVTATGDRLIVRQFLASRTVGRSDVTSFRVGGHRREAPGIAVRAVLRDGSTVVLAATGYYFRSRHDVETLCVVLQTWRRAG